MHALLLLTLRQSSASYVTTKQHWGMVFVFDQLKNVCLIAYSDADWAGCPDDRCPQGLNIQSDAKPKKQAQRRFHPLLTKKMDG